MKFLPPLILCSSLAGMLAACGGASTPDRQPDPVTPTEPVPPPVYADATPGASLQLWNRCEIPRSDTSYPSLPGSQADEKGFIRAITEETYLWSSELPSIKASDYPNVVAYFNALKTPALMPSGRPKDRFHFSFPNEVWAAMSSGLELGYGLNWNVGANKVPRQWRLALLDAGSSASLAGLRRGDQLIMIDGVDFINRGDAETVARFNAALTPTKTGEQHVFTWWRDGRLLETVLTADKLSTASVQFAQVLDSAAGKTGYLSFTSHNSPAERQLFDAITQFRAAGIRELVLDMRYNGGGLVTIASQLAYMIAGPAATGDKLFMQYATNGRMKPGSPTKFISKGMALPSSNNVPLGAALPHLDLSRVTILTGPGTCSASEAVINGLRGIDVDVRLVGEQTCGKPYAFLPMQNCGTTYFMVQYQGTNDKGWGKYDDGFVPDCKVADDMGHALGDPAEGVLAAALRLNEGGSCVAAAAVQGIRKNMAASANGNTVPDSDAATSVQPRSPLKELAILPERR